MPNPNWEYIAVDTNSMEVGKFYSVYTNADNATLVIPKENQDAINAQVTQHTADIQEIKEQRDDSMKWILDNQRRINNLEDTQINVVLSLIDQLSIRKYFQNATNIVVEHNRNTVTSVRVCVLVEDRAGILTYRDITGRVLIEEVIDDNSGKKSIVIKPSTPITGYCVVL